MTFEQFKELSRNVEFRLKSGMSFDEFRADCAEGLKQDFLKRIKKYANRPIPPIWWDWPETPQLSGLNNATNPNLVVPDSRYFNWDAILPYTMTQAYLRDKRN